MLVIQKNLLSDFRMFFSPSQLSHFFISCSSLQSWWCLASLFHNSLYRGHHFRWTNYSLSHRVTVAVHSAGHSVCSWVSQEVSPVSLSRFETAAARCLAEKILSILRQPESDPKRFSKQIESLQQRENIFQGIADRILNVVWRNLRASLTWRSSFLGKRYIT